MSETDGLRADFTLRRADFTLAATLSAPPGLTALLGPSGAGKSLTLQAIAGLESIARGVIHLNGRALADTAAGVTLAPRLRRVGFVPQSYALFPHLSVGANIAYGLPERLDRASREKRVAELLRLTHLPEYEARSPRDLSGGEAQRVALARALAARPEALLLDEPFSALDAPTRAAIRDDVREIALASGLPTLLVTHDLGEALALADRLALLVNGRVIAQGTVAEVTARPATLRAARLLGWDAALSLARVERVDGGARVTLPCGQALVLRSDECAAEALVVGDAASARLALRPERLAVSRAEADSAPDPTTRSLRGVVRSVTESGAFWRARVALDGAPDGDAPLDLPFSAREWRTQGLAPGDTLTLALTAGAARLVASGD
ncbi:MAG: ABC transporter ATP-binding protein [Chloroflexota bacterium]|nr:ABC transporter ATP-binding protein [Chloroflexota bacterium]